MRKEDAEEFTRSLGQIVGGSWRQIALAERIGIPKTLGLSLDQWVHDRFGGYVRMAVDDRRRVVVELAGKGLSAPVIAKVLGVNEKTVDRDKRQTGTNVPAGENNSLIPLEASGPNAEPACGKSRTQFARARRFALMLTTEERIELGAEIFSHDEATQVLNRLAMVADSEATA